MSTPPSNYPPSGSSPAQARRPRARRAVALAALGAITSVAAGTMIATSVAANASATSQGTSSITSAAQQAEAAALQATHGSTITKISTVSDYNGAAAWDVQVSRQGHTKAVYIDKNTGKIVYVDYSG